MIGAKLRRLAGIHQKSDFVKVVWRDATKTPQANRGQQLKEHIAMTYQWLCRAQDATPDAGVSAWYSYLSGWQPSYPETTGYIIPTLLEFVRQGNDPAAHQRALAMADWEIKVQLANGAVQGGDLGVEPEPAVFNTGQVIFGWVAAYRDSANMEYADAARRAADWLLDIQDGDGAWRRYLSVRTPTAVCTYNARSAWALVLLGQTLGEDRYVAAGCRNLDWSLTQQNAQGWFDNCGFFSGEIPMLHTIAYVLEGLLEAGLLLEVERYVAAARMALEVLVKRLAEDGTLLGRYDAAWRSPVTWRCLTGEAQVALCWLRLYEATGQTQFLDSGRRVNAQLMALQDLVVENQGRAGGVKGSHPIWGGYMPFAYPNWAAKFLLDSLLAQMRVEA